MTVIIDKTKKEKVFKGDKEVTLESINKITNDVISIYEKA